jgi:hypothetical protein
MGLGVFAMDEAQQAWLLWELDVLFYLDQDMRI